MFYARKMMLDEVDESSEGDWSGEDADSVECLVFQDNYVGYKPPCGVTSLVDKISADIAPHDFFEQYVKLRRPVIIHGLLNDTEWKGYVWSNNHLNEKAGNARLLVEDRMNSAGTDYLSYGTTAPKIEMRYGDFLSAITKGDSRYYMTTQDLEQSDNNCDELGLAKTVYSEPLRSLTDEFPIQPLLLGNLIPHQLSLWQGLAGHKQQSSSGLHHDFHDNLYVLIRGRKRFRLFPPSTLPTLKVTGTPVTIHRNGLIVYKSSGAHSNRITVGADGSPLVAVAQQKRDDAERDLLAAEDTLASLRSVTKSCDEKIEAAERIVDECEQRLDDALQELLRYEEDEDGTDSEDSHGDEPTVKRTKLETLAPLDTATTRTIKLPDHFSRVVLPEEDVTDPEVMFSQFETKDNVGCHVVELEAGEMLYLPASWFHEVSSRDSDQSEANEETGGGDSAGHLALNYWVYPPDNGSFDQPYVNDFWPRRWRELTNVATDRIRRA